MGWLPHLEPKIDIFERLHAIARGNIVLMIQFVGTIAGGPDAENARTLIVRVGLHALYRIKLNESFDESGVRENADLDEDARNGKFLYSSRVSVFIFQAGHELLTDNLSWFGISNDVHMLVRADFLDRNGISFQFFMPVNILLR